MVNVISTFPLGEIRNVTEIVPSFFHTISSGLGRDRHTIGAQEGLLSR